MRTIYSLQSIWKLKQASLQDCGHKDYYQAGKSVAGISEILPVANIMEDFASALET